MDAFPSYQVRFPPFVFDVKTGELRNNGAVVKLAPQPCRVLLLLTSRPGELVTRDEIRKTIWGEDTFVDFDKGLTFCIKQIRVALGDNADHSQYIETLPRRGYRFLAEVEKLEPVSAEAAADTGVEPQPQPSHSKFLNSHRRKTLIGFGIAAMLLTVLVSSWGPSPPELSFRERGWALVADFENRTGEGIFDDSVNYALQHELSNSRFVNVVPRERIRDVLLLMKKSPDIRLDLDTSREVAARDGNIQVLVNGRTEKIGSSYILSASLVDPGNGVALRSFSEEASTPEGVLLAARHVSAAIRRALGEHDWTATPPKLERATTRSLRALQLYSQGIALGNQRQWKAAAALFHEAVNEDPEFASAHVYLAHSHANLGKFPPAQHHFEVAFRLADTTSERERHFIRGSYYDFVGEEDKAIEAFRVLVELYPDDFWGVNNLALEYFYFGRLDEALPYFIRRAELRPNDLGTVYRAWRELRRSGRDAGKAEALFDQTQTLSQQPDADPIIWATITLDGVRRQLCLGDYSGVLQELERVRSSLPSHIGPRRTALSERLGRYFFDLGKLRAAEEQFSTLPEDWKHEALAYLAEEQGDMAALRFHLRRQLPIDENVWIVRQLALAGMTAQAAPLLIGQRAQLSYEPRFIDLARSAIFLAEGKTVEAIDLLTRLHQDATVSRDEIVLLVAIPLAEALEQRGDLSSAANVLTQALQANPLPENIRDLRKAKFHLSRLYRKLDREKEARALEAEVRQSLAVADADHPILRAMELDLHIRASR